jgi:hypothetical protein
MSTCGAEHLNWKGNHRWGENENLFGWSKGAIAIEQEHAP